MSTTTEKAPPDGDIASPLAHLSDEQIEALGREFEALHDEVFADLGERDARYIKSMIDLQRRLALLGRVLLAGSRFAPLWVAGTATLSLAKILENMEIGHNVMHGQWDWMNHPEINSATWDWDSASTPEAWKHSHNYVHHTFTNIRGKDRDLGYEIMRIDTHQPWHPVYLLQPLYNLLLMAFFQWGVALHDLDAEAIRSGEKKASQVRRELRGMAGKAWRQIAKDYVAFPLLSAAAAGALTAATTAAGIDTPSPRRGSRRPLARLQAGAGHRRAREDGVMPALSAIETALRRRDLSLPALLTGSRTERALTGAWRSVRRQGTPDRRIRPLLSARRSFRSTLSADIAANLVRNVWAYSIIFCGHFPDQTYTFSQREVEDETRGGAYVRQLVGAANIEGGPLFHVISGNLGYQVEHHLYPDMPSTRYGEIAPKVREICERYGLPYNTGPFSQQLGMVHRTILRLAFPGGSPRPKPGPYSGAKVRTEGERRGLSAAANGASASGAS